jgi:hypothetical protein
MKKTLLIIFSLLSVVAYSQKVNKIPHKKLHHKVRRSDFSQSKGTDYSKYIKTVKEPNFKISLPEPIGVESFCSLVNNSIYPLPIELFTDSLSSREQRFFVSVKMTVQKNGSIVRFKVINTPPEVITNSIISLLSKKEGNIRFRPAKNREKSIQLTIELSFLLNKERVEDITISSLNAKQRRHYCNSVKLE